MFVFCIYHYLRHGDLMSVAFAALAALFVFQRRPYLRDLPFDVVQGVNFGEVRGLAVRCDKLAVVFGGGTVNLVTAQRMPDEVRDMLRGAAEPANAD